MRTTILFLLSITILFAQNTKNVDTTTKSNQFIQRHIQQNLNILSNNPKCAKASKEKVLTYFNTTKTAKFINRYQK